jgi:hypothetical protein
MRSACRLSSDAGQTIAESCIGYGTSAQCSMQNHLSSPARWPHPGMMQTESTPRLPSRRTGACFFVILTGRAHCPTFGDAGKPGRTSTKTLSRWCMWL